MKVISSQLWVYILQFWLFSLSEFPSKSSHNLDYFLVNLSLHLTFLFFFFGGGGVNHRIRKNVIVTFCLTIQTFFPLRIVSLFPSCKLQSHNCAFTTQNLDIFSELWAYILQFSLFSQIPRRISQFTSRNLDFFSLWILYLAPPPPPSEWMNEWMNKGNCNFLSHNLTFSSQLRVFILQLDFIIGFLFYILDSTHLYSSTYTCNSEFVKKKVWTVTKRCI